MGELIKDVINSPFDKTQVASYDLSILLGVDRFFCAVKNPNQTLLRLAALELNASKENTPKENVQKALGQSAFLKLRYANVKVILRSTRFTLLPKRLYKKGEERVYLEKTAKLSSRDKIVVEELPDSEMLNIFAIESDLWEVLKGYYPVSDIAHSISPLIRSFQKYPASKSEKRVLLEVGTDSFQVVFLDGEELLFANTFAYTTPEDFVYYVMMVYDQFRLKPENCPLFLAGIIQKDSALYRILFRYIRHIYFVAFPGNLVLNKSVDIESNHIYFNLFGLW